MTRPVLWKADDMTERPIVLLLSGPNLNLLGSRQPEIYGTTTLADHVATASHAASDNGLSLEHLQSANESTLVEAVHAARGRCAAIVINAGALTHYSWSLHDALNSFDGVKVELHISNTHARDSWRHTSVIAGTVHGSIQGFGADGYAMAIEGVARLLRTHSKK